MDKLRQDLRDAFRTLLASPVLAGIAVLTLAVGIGANVTLFSLLHGIYLNPLPYEESERLVSISSIHQEAGERRTGVSFLDLEDWKAGISAFEDVAAYQMRNLNLSGAGPPERVHGALVTRNLFSTLRVAPAHGGSFTPRDGRAVAGPVTILSYGFWQRRFGGDPAVLGTTITLNGEPYTVIGVMPLDFVFLRTRPDLFVPLRMDTEKTHSARNDRRLNGLARLDAGATIERAQRELAFFAENLADEHPETNAGWGVRVEPLHDTVLPSHDIQVGFSIGFVALGLVLLIACANVAILLLARASTRNHELAVRAALGARWGRIVRQLMTESALLALAGGLLGIGLAREGVRAFIAASPVDTSIFDFRIDVTVLAFALCLSSATTLLFGLLPAIRAASTDIVKALKAGFDRTKGGGRRFARTLVIVEVALSFILLTAVTVMIQGVLRMHSKDLGFVPDGVLTLRMTPSETNYGDEETVDRFYREVLERIESLPEVVSAGSVDNLALTGADSVGPLTVVGRELHETRSVEVSLRRVSPGYFDALSVRHLAGRGFTPRDRSEAPLVAVVNETFVREWFSGRSPLGERIVVGDDRPREIIGVVHDFYEVRLDRPIAPVVYLPAAQAPARNRSLAVQVKGDAASRAAVVRRAIGSVDPEQPVFSVRPMTDYVSRAAWVFKMLTSSFGIFSVVALAMGAAGIYGVTSFGVNRRRNEIGLRMALGAKRSDVLTMVFKEGSTRTLAGIVWGIPLSFALTSGLAALLFGVSRVDVVVGLAVAMLLITVTLLACLVPASRASRVEPMEALRYE